MSDFSVIDPEAINNLRELSSGDDEFLVEIIDIFLDDTPKRIAELGSCLAAGDLETFSRAAHSIKGSAANLGALSLRAAAEKLEHHAREQGLNDTQGMIDEIKNAFAQAKTELDKIAGRG